MRYSVILITLIMIAALFGCGEKPNHTKVSLSPNKLLTLTVDVIKDDNASPGWWRPKIEDENGAVIYSENNNLYIGSLNIYWGWDGNDVWIYNSDDGIVRKYSINGKVVTVTKEEKSKCPAWILPDYAK